MQVYLIEERFDDVFCENSKCRKKINCFRRIHEVTTNQQHAISQTKDKSNWGYLTFEVNISK